jgi:hypothetical protein
LVAQALDVLVTPALVYHYAEALEYTGRRREALEQFTRARSLARSECASDRYVLDSTGRRIANLEQALAHVVIVVDPSAARVSIDGAADTSEGHDVFVEPGEHVVTAEAEGYQSSEQRVTAVGGSVTHVNIALAATPVARVDAEPERSAPATSHDDVSPFVISGITALALGAVALGIGIGVNVDRESSIRSYNDGSCNPARMPMQTNFSACPSLGLRLADEQTAAEVLYVAAGVVGALGAVLLGIGLASHDANETSVSCAPIMQGGLACAGSF